MRGNTQELIKDNFLFDDNKKHSKEYLANLEKFNRGVMKIKKQREFLSKRIEFNLSKRSILGLNLFIITMRLKYVIGLSLLLIMLILGGIVFNLLKSQEFEMFTGDLSKDHVEEISKIIYTVGYSYSLDE
ncbi:MAG: hypothetical protein ACP5PT_03085 [Brevinematia bacterium]